MIPKKCSSEEDKIDVIIVSVKKDRTELKDLSSWGDIVSKGIDIVTVKTFEI